MAKTQNSQTPTCTMNLGEKVAKLVDASKACGLSAEDFTRRRRELQKLLKVDG